MLGVSYTKLATLGTNVFSRPQAISFRNAQPLYSKITAGQVQCYVPQIPTTDCSYEKKNIHTQLLHIGGDDGIEGDLRNRK